MSMQLKPPGSCVATMSHDSGAVVMLAPTSEFLESGVVLGLIEATEQWAPYSALATDGRNVATGVLYASWTPSERPRRALVIVGEATVIRTELIGLDDAAEQQLLHGPRVLPLMADPPPAEIRVR